jgi:hypothetical protein
MADDTLLPVGFDTSRIAKTHLNGQERFAMAVSNAQCGGGIPQAAFVRHVLLLGLKELGWTEEKMIKEYADYRVRCIQRREINPYESE